MLNQTIIASYIQGLRPRMQKIKVQSSNEENLRSVFIELLNRCGAHKNLWVAAKEPLSNKKKPDGTIKSYYTTHGYWEAKSPALNLNTEISKKIKLGCPLFNTIFENSNQCVLFQNNKETNRIKHNMWNNTLELSKTIDMFFNFQTEEAKKFNKAKKTFFEKNRFLTLIKGIEQKINSLKNNSRYLSKVNNLATECRQFINPYFEQKNIEQWIIQHLLTEQIFLKVFGEQQFLETNNIAQSIKLIEKEFFIEKKQEIVSSISPYMHDITNYGNKLQYLEEKQSFLKDIYQNFYKCYDPNTADQMGVVYTPSEVVKFIVKSTNYFLEKHFNKSLKDKGVHILDPATGTGTFIAELMEEIFNSSHNNKDVLQYKYEKEIHANENMALPYYVAHLNIEYVFKELTKKRQPFERLVLMDTLQNSAHLSRQISMEEDFSKNQKKANQQNTKTITVITGNPPWNQHQQSYQDNNQNKVYPALRQRIQSTYSKHSQAQKKKINDDKYTFFLRWATDRIGSRGIVSFVINRSFLDSRSGDGLRKCLYDEFNNIYIVDLGGDIRKGSAKKSNVFENIQVGNCIIFLVKNEQTPPHNIKYFNLQTVLAEDKGCLKLSELQNNLIMKYFKKNKFKDITPNAKHQWLNQETPFKGCKLSDVYEKTYLGISTNRDNDVYDDNKHQLAKRITRLIKAGKTKISFKPSRDFNKKIKKGALAHLKFNKNKIITAAYRNTENKYLYADPILCDRLTQNYFKIWGEQLKTKAPVLVYELVRNRFCVQLLNKPFDKNFFKPGGHSARGIPLNWIKNMAAKNRNGIKKQDIPYYIIGLFFSNKYKTFIEANNFDMKNPPIPIYKDHQKYIQQGKNKMKTIFKNNSV